MLFEFYCTSLFRLAVTDYMSYLMVITYFYKDLNCMKMLTQQLTNDVKLKHRGMPCAFFSVNIIQFRILMKIWVYVSGILRTEYIASLSFCCLETHRYGSFAANI